MVWVYDLAAQEGFVLLQGLKDPETMATVGRVVFVFAR